MRTHDTSARACVRVHQQYIWRVPTNLPTERLEFRFARSSGAGRSNRALHVGRAKQVIKYRRETGGQNVNKLNTKCDVRFHVASADWLPEAVRAAGVCVAPPAPTCGVR